MRLYDWTSFACCVAFASGVATSQVTPPPSIGVDAIVEPWTYRGGLSPGGWVSIYGSDLAAREAFWQPADGQPLPVTLGGSTVRINGIAAALSYASRNMINILVPGYIGVGDVTITVDREGSVSTPVVAQLKRINPAIYSLPVVGAQPAKFYVTALLAGTSQLIGTARADSRVTRAARPGDPIDLYLTGLGRSNLDFPTDRMFSGAFPLAEPVDVELGPTRITPDFAGLVSPGLYLVRFKVPATLAAQEALIRIVSGDIRSADNVFLTVESPQVTLESVTMTPATVTGGEPSTGTLTLTGPAPAPGVDVQVRLGTQSPVAFRVATGQRTGTFRVNTVAAVETRTLTITASFNGTERTTTLTVLPVASVSPLRDYEVIIDASLTLEGRQVQTRITSSVPGVLPNALVSGTDPVASGVIIYAHFVEPAVSGNTATFPKVFGGSQFTNLRGAGSGTILSGKLTLTASSAGVGTTVTGTLEFATAAKSYSTSLTGRIINSTRVR